MFFTILVRPGGESRCNKNKRTNRLTRLNLVLVKKQLSHLILFYQAEVNINPIKIIKGQTYWSDPFNITNLRKTFFYLRAKILVK